MQHGARLFPSLLRAIGRTEFAIPVCAIINAQCLPSNLQHASFRIESTYIRSETFTHCLDTVTEVGTDGAFIQVAQVEHQDRVERGKHSEDILYIITKMRNANSDRENKTKPNLQSILHTRERKKGTYQAILKPNSHRVP